MPEGLDTRAAVTRSMLGWGVVAGPFYLTVGVILALTRDGFHLSRHALSLLALGEDGWIHILNLALTGIMVIIAGCGLWRGIDRRGRGRGAAIAVIIAGVSIALAGVFRPDPAADFPTSTEPVMTLSGVVHLVLGAVEFLAFAFAALHLVHHFARRGERSRVMWSRMAAGVIILAFVAGAALAAGPAGVGLLWVAVGTSFAWLLTASLWVYRIVPHPDLAKRSRADEGVGPGSGAVDRR